MDSSYEDHLENSMLNFNRMLEHIEKIKDEITLRDALRSVIVNLKNSIINNADGSSHFLLLVLAEYIEASFLPHNKDIELLKASWKNSIEIIKIEFMKQYDIKEGD